ncbi:MAG: ATP-dependent zinc metalloprotease FtsH [Planctomycetaceae bacterium]|nr:ATP-dependent zinc metalloprotease FtsH [Planctomycetaceae bacterium]
MSDPSGGRPSGGNSSGPKRPEEPRRSPMPLLLAAMLVISVFWIINSGASVGTTVPYGMFFKQLKKGNVKEVTIKGEILTGKWVEIPPDGETPETLVGKLKEDFNTVLLSPYAGESVLASELEKQVESGKLNMLDADRQTMSRGMELLSWLIIPIIFVFLFYMMMRRSGDPFSGGMMGGFIRSPARKFEKNEQHTTYDDVAGLKTAKQDLQEIVEFLKNPKRFTKLGARIPKGVLLEGPPGTGKTLLARATAGEAGVPFFSINGSEFIQMFVGVGATRVRDLFKTAREASPCIIFIDEIDAVGRIRGAGVGGGHDEREQTLNQILSEMDGFEKTEAVIVLAATNRSDVLDPALLRPGRFDRHVTVDKPAREGRLGILKVHTRKVPLADDVDLEALSKSTMGYSGAELEKLVNEAALKAARGKKRSVEMEDFYHAEDLIVMGARRDEHVDDNERRLTAFHEAGHAILAWYQEGMDPVHKVSIVPRGRSGGVTRFQAEKEVPNVGRSAFFKRLIMTMGGRAAEKIIFDEYSAGAVGDIEQATRIARHMVAHWGMSEKVGPVAFKQSEEHPFLGKEMQSSREFSEETARIIDVEVTSILKEANETAIEMLHEYREQMDALAEALLEHEDIEHEELIKILGPRPGAKVEEASGDSDKPAAVESDTIAGAETQSDHQEDESPGDADDSPDGGDDVDGSQDTGN